MVNSRNKEANVAGRDEPGELWEIRAEGQRDPDHMKPCRFLQDERPLEGFDP